jgi:toxin ParE1/3/4
MKGLEFTPKAQRDLEDIWRYSLSEWGVERADSYVAEIRGVIDGLRTGGTASRNADSVRRGYRTAMAARHLIVFRDSADTVEVIRVLHQRMDAGRWV